MGVPARSRARSLRSAVRKGSPLRSDRCAARWRTRGLDRRLRCGCFAAMRKMSFSHVPHDKDHGGVSGIASCQGAGGMEYDRDKVDEMVLALLWLTPAGDGRAWKGHDWDVLDRLHAKGYISDPKSKAKSVVLSEEGERLSRELFERHFARKQ